VPRGSETPISNINVTHLRGFSLVDVNCSTTALENSGLGSVRPRSLGYGLCSSTSYELQRRTRKYITKVTSGRPLEHFSPLLLGTLRVEFNDIGGGCDDKSAADTLDRRSRARHC
jgi:hypothetical protein